MTVFKLLAKLKCLRGSRWDVFGHTQERRQERELIVEYRQTVRQLLADLCDENYEFAVEIAALPKKIRGFGHVKKHNVVQAQQQQAILLDRFYGRDDKVARIQTRNVA